MRPPIPTLSFACAALLAAACASPDPEPVSIPSTTILRPSETVEEPAPLPAPEEDPPSVPLHPSRPWIETGGTTTLGFGILRLAPAPGAAAGRFRIEFHDRGDGGYSSDGTDAALFVLPGDAFAGGPAAFADGWLAFGRGEAEAGGYSVVSAVAEVAVEGDRVVLVAYGPWNGADVGRPPSDRHTFTLRVVPLDGGRYRWIESEAGEMVTTNWTGRPGVERGGPVTDPLTREPLWIETRVLVLYDAAVARAAASPAKGGEDRIPLPDDVYAVLKEVPIRWR